MFPKLSHYHYKSNEENEGEDGDFLSRVLSYKSSSGEKPGSFSDIFNHINPSHHFKDYNNHYNHDSNTATNRLLNLNNTGSSRSVFDRRQGLSNKRIVVKRMNENDGALESSNSDRVVKKSKMKDEDYIDMFLNFEQTNNASGEGNRNHSEQSEENDSYQSDEAKNRDKNDCIKTEESGFVNVEVGVEGEKMRMVEWVREGDGLVGRECNIAEDDHY